MLRGLAALSASLQRAQATVQGEQLLNGSTATPTERTEPRKAVALSQIDVGSVIPSELYTVVPDVLAYVYRFDDRVRRRR